MDLHHRLIQGFGAATSSFAATSFFGGLSPKIVVPTLTDPITNYPTTLPLRYPQKGIHPRHEGETYLTFELPNSTAPSKSWLIPMLNSNPPGSTPTSSATSFRTFFSKRKSWLGTSGALERAMAPMVITPCSVRFVQLSTMCFARVGASVGSQPDFESSPIIRAHNPNSAIPYFLLYHNSLKGKVLFYFI